MQGCWFESVTLLCSISLTSANVKLIQKAKLIIWDEAPMMDKQWYESVDRTSLKLGGYGSEYLHMHHKSMGSMTQAGVYKDPL